MAEIEKLEKVAFILKTIAHPLRLSVIDLLIKKEAQSVGELCEQLDVEQSLLSHHLSVLKQQGVLGCEREGKQMRYSLLLKEVIKVIDCIENCEVNH